MSVISAGTLNNMTGTAQMYDPVGNAVMAPMPITGDFDDSAGTVIIDPWMFFGMHVMSEIELLPPGTHTRPGAGTVTVAPGQVGGFIQTDWAASTDIPAFIVWDVTTVGSASRYEPVDSDGDGIPGHAMISGPFPGFSIAYELDVGGSIPDVDVDLNVPGGLTQECSETGGTSVNLTATATLKGGATLGSISWAVDGADAGTGSSITPFLSLGEHTVEVTAMTTNGVTDTESTTVNIRDTQQPSLDIEFIDTSTGMAITEIDSPRVSYVEVRLNSDDVCDEDPAVSGVAKPVTAITGGEVIRIQGNIQDTDMPTTAIEVTANATDDSGNKEMDQAILNINN
ncbi:hypothetical protein D6C00_05385 [Thiohalobacter thiocyanaticus]|uniref:Uncharacterized protein n=2 Tax=Thiohalobacter thiocyanaticus TaxID=585455 RepID=A0A426QI54_9GAMM|nr:hypothetical protein D6C00_05385 [Thiohalobacter thiocyanaticus]